MNTHDQPELIVKYAQIHFSLSGNFTYGFLLKLLDFPGDNLPNKGKCEQTFTHSD